MTHLVTSNWMTCCQRHADARVHLVLRTFDARATLIMPSARNETFVKSYTGNTPLKRQKWGLSYIYHHLESGLIFFSRMWNSISKVEIIYIKKTIKLPVVMVGLLNSKALLATRVAESCQKGGRWFSSSSRIHQRKILFEVKNPCRIHWTKKFQ